MKMTYIVYLIPLGFGISDEGEGRYAGGGGTGAALFIFQHRFELDGMSFEEPVPNLFSFNNPFGACPVL